MGTEIAKSKISIKLRVSLSDDMVVPYDLMIEAADAIDELNQRLIDQTASGMERGKKDQDEIKRMNRELAQLQAEKSRWQDARKAGREEAFTILTRTNPEKFSNECFRDYLDHTDEYYSVWQVDFLKALFNLDDQESLYDELELQTYDQMYKIQDLENELNGLQQSVTPLLAVLSDTAELDTGEQDCVAKRAGEVLAEFRAKYPQKEGA